MFIPLAVVGLGWLAFRRREPDAQTRVEQATSIGSISGLVYEVENIPAADILVVRRHDAQGVLLGEVVLHKRDGRYHYVRSWGDGKVLRTIHKDFSVIDDDDERAKQGDSPPASSRQPKEGSR